MNEIFEKSNSFYNKINVLIQFTNMNIVSKKFYVILLCNLLTTDLALSSPLGSGFVRNFLPYAPQLLLLLQLRFRMVGSIYSLDG